MKKLLPSIILAFLFIGNTLFAQFSIGGGIHYDTGIKRIGFTAKAKYVFNQEEWAASPSYSIYPSEGATIKIIDLDAHYQVATVFVNEIGIYGLAGLGFVDQLTSNKVALNGGFGVNIPTDNSLNIFGEVKFRVNKVLGTQIGGGVLYQF